MRPILLQFKIPPAPSQLIHYAVADVSGVPAMIIRGHPTGRRGARTGPASAAKSRRLAIWIMARSGLPSATIAGYFSMHVSSVSKSITQLNRLPPDPSYLLTIINLISIRYATLDRIAAEIHNSHSSHPSHNSH